MLLVSLQAFDRIVFLKALLKALTEHFKDEDLNGGN